MTPDELREARAKMGLSTAGLAKALRLGAGGARTVRRWESGASGIPGPATVALEFMLDASFITQPATRVPPHSRS